MGCTRASALLAATLVLVAASRLSAQDHSITINPMVGMYIPNGSALIDQPGAIRNQPVLRKQPVGGPVFALRMSTWLRPHIGVEGTIGYSPALVAVHSAGAVDDISQRLILGSVKGVYRFNRDDESALSLQVGSGLGYVSRGGEAWQDTPARPAPALVFSAGARAHLDNRNRVVFRADLEDYVSWTKFTTRRSDALPSRMYNDLILLLGVAIPVGERGHTR